METVEVMIRVSKKDLETINDPKGKGKMQDNMESYKRMLQIADRIFLAIEKCTVLPKGHGRLGDIDFEVKHYENILDNPTPDVTRYDRENAPIILKALRMIGTVIEADRGDDND